MRTPTLVALLLAGSLLGAGPVSHASKWKDLRKAWSAKDAPKQNINVAPNLAPTTTARFTSEMITDLEGLRSLGRLRMSGPSLRLAYRALKRGRKASLAFVKETDPARRQAFQEQALEAVYVIDILRPRMRAANFSVFLNPVQEAMVRDVGEKLGTPYYLMAEQFHLLHPELEAPLSLGVQGLAPRQM